MIHQYFVDISSNGDNYNQILSFCKNFMNPTNEPTITRLVGDGNNGKTSLMLILSCLTTHNVVRIPSIQFTQAYVDRLNLTNPSIIYIEEIYGPFFSTHDTLVKNFPNNLHIVYVANTVEPLLATLNTKVNTIYMMQHVDNPNMTQEMLDVPADVINYINNH